jgi:hypothetical protein
MPQPESFLSALTDSTGSFYLFGKSEESGHNLFTFSAKEESIKDTTKYTDIYRGHALKRTHNYPVPRQNITPDWFFPLILITLAFFAWLRVFYNRFFIQMIQALLNNNLANQIVRDENIFIQRASVYLSIIFNLIAALLLYLVSMHYGWSLGGIGSGFSRFLFFLILVSSAYALKFLVLKACGWLFEQEREMATYIFNIFLINNILGIILLPFICLIAYNETISITWLVLIPMIIIGLAFGWRLVRGIQIGIGISSFSPLYLFLYLCTLEIAPLMVLIRVIVQ